MKRIFYLGYDILEQNNEYDIYTILGKYVTSYKTKDWDEFKYFIRNLTVP